MQTAILHNFRVPSARKSVRSTDLDGGVLDQGWPTSISSRARTEYFQILRLYINL
jgi:hypothetical protein